MFSRTLLLLVTNAQTYWGHLYLLIPRSMDVATHIIQPVHEFFSVGPSLFQFYLFLPPSFAVHSRRQEAAQAAAAAAAAASRQQQLHLANGGAAIPGQQMLQQLKNPVNGQPAPGHIVARTRE